MENMLKAIKRKRLYEDIVQQIQELVREGTLKPGDRLPPERELAERLQVSRSSLREAIRALELQGVVVSRPGAGTFINTDSVEDLVSTIASCLTAGRNDLSDIFEMRRLLEPQITALAVERATVTNVRRMAKTLQDQELQIAKGQTGVESDTAFHFAIAEATHNSALVRVFTTIADILRQSRDLSLQAPGRPQRSLDSHREILKKILERDMEGAREAMAHHISAVEPVILSEGAEVPVAVNGLG
jgi:GntR family transcriptional repressor for pyruvate dehydrogenase complex